MKKSLKKSLKKAGLSEEKIRQYDSYLDARKKRLKRENQAIRDGNITFLSLDVMLESQDGDTCIPEIADESVDVEEEAIRNVYIEKLQAALEILTKAERNLLLTCFEVCNDTLVAEMYGISRQRLQYKKDKLIVQLREKMGIDANFEKN